MINELDIKLRAAEIRATQLAVADSYANQMMRCPVHLSIGQEYWLPLIKHFKKNNDRFFSSHRSHSLYLALSNDVDSYFSELFGLSDGVTKGKGGSMHLKSLENGLEASIPIVGSSIGLALGSALSHKIISRDNSKTISYFGDGACEEGILHESLNMASIYQLPLLFICENNLYSCNTRIQNRQPSENMARFADAHNIQNEQISQEECLGKIISKFEKAFEISKSMPYFLEIKSYRLYEHCGHKKDIKNGDRTSSEYAKFSNKDIVSKWIEENKSINEAFNNTYKKSIDICKKLAEFSFNLKNV